MRDTFTWSVMPMKSFTFSIILIYSSSLYFLAPNIAVPIRIMLEPSSIAFSSARDVLRKPIIHQIKTYGCIVVGEGITSNTITDIGCFECEGYFLAFFSVRLINFFFELYVWVRFAARLRHNIATL